MKMTEGEMNRFCMEMAGAIVPGDPEYVMIMAQRIRHFMINGCDLPRAVVRGMVSDGPQAVDEDVA